MYPNLSDPMPKLIHPLPEWIRSYPIRYQSFTPSSGMDPTRSDPIPKLTHLLPKRARPYPTLYRSFYLIFRCGFDPIRSEAGAYTYSTGVYPILSDAIPKLIHRIRSALSPIKSQRWSSRLRCDSIESQRTLIDSYRISSGSEAGSIRVWPHDLSHIAHMPI